MRILVKWRPGVSSWRPRVLPCLPAALQSSAPKSLCDANQSAADSRSDINDRYPIVSVQTTVCVCIETTGNPTITTVH